METLVATVLIVVIFMISSMLLNNLLSNSIRAKAHPVQEKLYELKYTYQNGNLDLPYYDEMDGWEVSVREEQRGATTVITFGAEKKGLDKSIIETVIHEE